MSSIVSVTSLPTVHNQASHDQETSTPSVFKKTIQGVQKIWKTMTSGISTFMSSPFEVLSSHSLLQKMTMKKLGERAKQCESYIEKTYFKELKDLVAGLKKTDDPAVFLERIDTTAKQLEELVVHAKGEAHNLIRKLETEPSDKLIGKADHLYRHCMNTLHDLQQLPGTDIQRSVYAGRLTTIFRELDDAFSDDKGVTLHRYCGCHIKSKDEDHGLKLLAPGIRGKDPKFLVDHPQHESHGSMPAHTSAVLMSQSYGGGHNVVQHATSQRIAERGGHAYKIEADEEVFEAYYNYRKRTGKSGAEWSQFFLQGNYFRTIRFLGWLSSGNDSKKTREGKINCFARSLLARGQQDLAVMCFQRGTSPAEKAASRLGTGLYEIATDLDYAVFDFKKDAENPHYKHGMMARDSEREKQVLSRALHPHQLVENGFPVRDAFLKNYSVEELAQIRTQYQQKYNLEPDARVVLLLCGGEGVSNTMAETLAKKYPPNGPKIHLFAVCGKNEKKKNILEEQFAKLNQSNFRATALGWTNEKELGELFAMGALEKDKGLLITAKAGGGTTSEAIARGIPILGCEMTGIHHERLNLDFVVERQLGKEFKNEGELPSKVVEMLGTPFTPIPSPDGEAYSDFHSKEKSMQAIQNIVEDCRTDTGFQYRKTQAIATLPLAASCLSSSSLSSAAMLQGGLADIRSSHPTLLEKRSSSSEQEQLAKTKKWIRKFGWDELLKPALLERPGYANFLNFLYESRLIFTIRGYQASSQGVDSALKKGIQFVNGEPYFLMEGRWTVWNEIFDTLQNDLQSGIPGQDPAAAWSYIYPHGFTKQTRFNWIGKVHQMTSEEMDRLYKHGKTFFQGQQGQTEKMPSQENCAFLQVVTNAESFLGGHVAVRLIDQNGKLYSLGFGRQKIKNPLAMIFSILGTVNAGISSIDYTEFGKFDVRRVTTVPVNLETFHRLVQKVQDYAATPLRFNFLHQNCVTFTADLLREAGAPVEVRTPSGSEIVFNAFAPQCIRKTAQWAQNFFANTPNCIRKPIQFIAAVITYLPSKIFTLLKNLFVLILGAGKMNNSPKPGAENELENKDRLTSFNHLFNNWTDLFKDIPISVPYKIADWQMEQGSTQLHAYAGPKFYVV